MGGIDLVLDPAAGWADAPSGDGKTAGDEEAGMSFGEMLGGALAAALAQSAGQPATASPAAVPVPPAPQGATEGRTCSRLQPVAPEPTKPTGAAAPPAPAIESKTQDGGIETSAGKRIEISTASPLEIVVEIAPSRTGGLPRTAPDLDPTPAGSAPGSAIEVPAIAPGELGAERAIEMPARSRSAISPGSAA
ncbi:MAG TPA: hypothetical protein VNO33_22195, partial [Kofleriaceae bacterium]|nr:hypothetical protein [Kofleriaceae bacterium]